MIPHRLLAPVLLGVPLLVYVIGGVLRVFKAPFLSLAASIPDDTFYYLLPALNFRETHTFTFDRIHPTYGFQPLWEVVLVLLAYVVPAREDFLRVTLALCYLLRAATAVVMADTAGHLCPSASAAARLLAGLMAAMLFLGNEPYGAIATSGKEGALYGLLFACALRLCARAAVAAPEERRVHGGLLGALLAGMVLARVTPSSVLAVVAFATWALRHGARRRALGAGLVLPIGAWCVYALAAFGTPFPTSGSVKLLLSLGTLKVLGPAGIPQALLAWVGPYLKEVLQFSLGLSSRFWGVAHSPTQWLLAAWSLSALGIALLHGPVRSRLRPLLWMLLVAVAGTALVPILLFAHGKHLYYFAWYVNELPLLLALLGGVALPIALSSRAAVGASVATALLFTLRAWAAVGPPPRDPEPPSAASAVIEVSRLAMRELGVTRSTRIAAYDAGLLGYLLSSHVINMDALANNDRLQAAKEGISDLRYMRRERVEYIANVNLPRTWLTAVGDVVGEFPSWVNSPDDRMVVLRFDPARPCHEGFQHAAACDRVLGWAWNCAQPDERVELEILDGGDVIARTRADRFETHLLRAGIGDGRHGFEVDLDLPSDGRTHSITVRAAGSGLTLQGAPMAFGCGR